MPGQNVNWPPPLTRAEPWYPGQMGVPGSDNTLGLRQHTQGAIYYVDPNHPDASDAHDGTNPDHPLLTVAHAITHCAASHGDVIAVMANNGWQYGNTALGHATTIHEEVTLNVPGVRLVGVAPAGTVGVVWTPHTAAGAGTCITVTASDCLIEGFSFQGGVVGGRGISVVWDGATSFGDNLIIRHCLFDDDMDICIQMDYAYYVDISDCIFQEPDNYAIYDDPAGSAPAYLNIHDNWFINCATGGAIIVSEAGNSLINHNYIFNAAAQSGAAATNLGINTSAGAGLNLVVDNFLSCKLPCASAGDFDDFCSADPTDAWIGNHLLDGSNTTNPT